MTAPLSVADLPGLGPPGTEAGGKAMRLVSRARIPASEAIEPVNFAGGRRPVLRPANAARCPEPSARFSWPEHDRDRGVSNRALRHRPGRRLQPIGAKPVFHPGWRFHRPAARNPARLGSRPAPANLADQSAYTDTEATFLEGGVSGRAVHADQSADQRQDRAAGTEAPGVARAPPGVPSGYPPERDRALCRRAGDGERRAAILAVGAFPPMPRRIFGYRIDTGRSPWRSWSTTKVDIAGGG